MDVNLKAIGLFSNLVPTPFHTNVIFQLKQLAAQYACKRLLFHLALFSQTCFESITNLTRFDPPKLTLAPCLSLILQSIQP